MLEDFEVEVPIFRIDLYDEPVENILAEHNHEVPDQKPAEQLDMSSEAIEQRIQMTCRDCGLKLI